MLFNTHYNKLPILDSVRHYKLETVQKFFLNENSVGYIDHKNQTESWI